MVNLRKSQKKKIERIREDKVRRVIMPKVKNGFLSSHFFLSIKTKKNR